MSSSEVVEVQEHMGTAVSICVRGKHLSSDIKLQEKFIQASRMFAKVDELFSLYREDSEASLIRKGKLSMEQAHPWLQEIATLGEGWRSKTSGHFNLNYDGCWDPTGLVKGWACEKVTREIFLPLLEDGVEAVGVNMGGDVQVFTHPMSSWVWKIGVVNPLDRTGYISIIPLRNGGVATSGFSERGAHIFRGGDGSAAEWLQATVVSHSLATADVWATAACSMGWDLTWLSKTDQSSGLIVNAKGEVRSWARGLEIMGPSAFTGVLSTRIPSFRE